MFFKFAFFRFCIFHFLFNFSIFLTFFFPSHTHSLFLSSSFSVLFSVLFFLNVPWQIQLLIPMATDLFMLLPMLLSPMLRVMPTTNNSPTKILPPQHDDAGGDVSSKATNNKEADLNNNHHHHDHTAPLPAPRTK